MKNPKREDLKCPGVFRFSDNKQMIGFNFNRVPTDGEMHVLHSLVQSACCVINEGQAELDELEEIGEISKWSAEFL